jgi:phosphatidate cytidylyltransferase
MDLVLPLRWTMGGVLATLVAASTTTAALTRLRPSLDLSEVRVRVRSWWVMAGVFLAATVVDARLTMLLLTAIGVVAVFELARMTGTVVLAVAVPTALAANAAAATGRVGWVPSLVVAAGVVAALRDVVTGRPSGIGHRTGATMTAAAVAAALSCAVAVAASTSPGLPAGGPGLLLWMVIVAQAGDVTQFLAGRIFGRHRLAPRVSPNKTVEGFIGGVVAAGLLGGALGVLLTTWPFVVAAGAGVVVAICGSLGDLIVSAFKRDRGLEDTGSLIPGHGGVLDRIDSLLLVAPLVLLVAA